jgi:hypothetical protein
MPFILNERGKVRVDGVVHNAPHPPVGEHSSTVLVEALTIVVPVAQKAKKRKKMSAEGRERIRQAQLKRWAALKETPKEKKKAAKAA